MKRLLPWAVLGLVIVVLSRTTFDYASRVGPHGSPASNRLGTPPAVVGWGRERALEVLGQKGFSTVAIFVPNGSARRGTVFRQSSHRSTHTPSGRVEKLLVSSGRAPSCPAEQPRTVLRLTTRLHSPELVPRCIVAAAGQRLTLLFHDNLVGAPANLSIYPDISTFAIVDGKAVVTTRVRERALFVGHRSWLAKRVIYHVRALPPGTYVVQGDSYPSLMRADLVVRPTT